MFGIASGAPCFYRLSRGAFLLWHTWHRRPKRGMNLWPPSPACVGRVGVRPWSHRTCFVHDWLAWTLDRRQGICLSWQSRCATLSWFAWASDRWDWHLRWQSRCAGLRSSHLPRAWLTRMNAWPLATVSSGTIASLSSVRTTFGAFHLIVVLCVRHLYALWSTCFCVSCFSCCVICGHLCVPVSALYGCVQNHLVFRFLLPRATHRSFRAMLALVSQS